MDELVNKRDAAMCERHQSKRQKRASGYYHTHTHTSSRSDTHHHYDPSRLVCEPTDGAAAATHARLKLPGWPTDFPHATGPRQGSAMTANRNDPTRPPGSAANNALPTRVRAVVGPDRPYC